MQTHLDCIPCFLKQALEATRMVTTRESTQTQVLQNVMNYLQQADLSKSPPELSQKIHQIIRTTTHSPDPYKTVKIQANTQAKKHLPHLKKQITASQDPLLLAIKLAIVGNVIDYGTMTRLNIDEMINKALTQPFDLHQYPTFKNQLKTTKSILILGDNTGEIIFDTLLLQELSEYTQDITYVVKAHPIINDAQKNDALYAGIDNYATIIEADTGQPNSSPGILLHNTTPRFKRHFTNADIILSKGQGNYEGLNTTTRQIYFLFMIKCPLIAQLMGKPVGTPILQVNQ
jgi:uncharacterized protein with ATP-grasp and redox domains